MTMYFPLVVHGAMLVEPTESQAKEDLDLFIAALRCSPSGRSQAPPPRSSRRRPALRRAVASTRRWPRASRCSAGGPATPSSRPQNREGGPIGPPIHSGCDYDGCGWQTEPDRPCAAAAFWQSAMD